VARNYSALTHGGANRLGTDGGAEQDVTTLEHLNILMFNKEIRWRKHD